MAYQILADRRDKDQDCLGSYMRISRTMKESEHLKNIFKNDLFPFL